jgi:transposase-like protein
MRRAEGKESGQECLKELCEFVSGHSKAGVKSLEEAGEDLIGFHSLGAPSTLNVAFLSTNAIENSFRNLRRKLGRVSHWRGETDQASRWVSYGLLEVEKGFRRVNGYGDLHLLKEALRLQDEGVDN